MKLRTLVLASAMVMLLAGVAYVAQQNEAAGRPWLSGPQLASP